MKESNQETPKSLDSRSNYKKTKSVFLYFLRLNLDLEIVKTA